MRLFTLLIDPVVLPTENISLSHDRAVLGAGLELAPGCRLSVWSVLERFMLRVRTEAVVGKARLCDTEFGRVLERFMLLSLGARRGLGVGGEEGSTRYCCRIW